MKWEADSSLLTINETKFLLTTPCLKRADEFLIARVDLVKWIDPLLRPAIFRRPNGSTRWSSIPATAGWTTEPMDRLATKRLTLSTSLAA